MPGYKALPTGAAGGFREPSHEPLRGARISAALGEAVEWERRPTNVSGASRDARAWATQVTGERRQP
jgi:hypothetical protein